MVLPQGTQLPPVVAPPPGAAEVAWVALLPTSAPGLSADEAARVLAVRDGTTDPRIRSRADAILEANGTG